jgi:hypothetical protein
MYTGPFPPASVWGTWSENIEIWDVDTDTLMDLTGVTEIKVILRDAYTRFDEVTLLMSQGQVTIPSTGIVQWRVEASQMSQLNPKTYEVRILFLNDTDTVPIVLGSVSVVE